MGALRILMPSRTAAAALLLAAGVLIGTITDVVPERTAPRIGDYWILSGDFHVHAFPGDGLLPPSETVREARRAGLDVIAVTNHTGTLAARMAHQMNDDEGPMTIVGQEVTNARYHLIAVGLTSPIDADQPAAAAIAAIHAQGGVAIAAHPGRIYWAAYDPALPTLDGTEIAHPQIHRDRVSGPDFAQFHERTRARNPGVAAIGSSDFHGSPELGRCRTYLLVRERTEAGVLDAIRNGRTVAVDANDVLYGDPEWVRLVAAHRPAGRVAPGLWARLGTVFAWLGGLGLLLFPVSRSASAALLTAR
jgi:hypothetical protein